MSITDTIKTEADTLLKKIVDTYEIEVTEEDEVYHVIIKTEEGAPTVIGRHGETIRALQKILEVIMYKSQGEPVSILVNVNDYREKQRERLEGIASQLADRAKTSGRPSYFRGLSAYERKMVHEYVTNNHPDLTTYSVGDGRDRQLVIDQKGNEPKEESSES